MSNRMRSDRSSSATLAAVAGFDAVAFAEDIARQLADQRVVVHDQDRCFPAVPTQGRGGLRRVAQFFLRQASHQQFFQLRAVHGLGEVI